MKLYKEFIFNGHIMAIGAALSGLSVLLLLDIEVSLVGVLLLYLIIEPIYILIGG